MIRAIALAQSTTGRLIECSARDTTKKAARYKAVGLLREGETLISVRYEEEQ